MHHLRRQKANIESLTGPTRIRTARDESGETVYLVHPKSVAGLVSAGIEIGPGYLQQFPACEFSGLRWKRIPTHELERIYGSIEAATSALAGAAPMPEKARGHAGRIAATEQEQSASAQR